MKKIVLSLFGLGLILLSSVAMFLMVGTIAESELLIVLAIIAVAGLGVKFSQNKARQ